MGNTISVTQTFIDTTDEGRRIYLVNARATGDGSSAAIAVPITKLKRIHGTPAWMITEDDQVANCFLVSNSTSGTTVTVTVSAVVENLTHVTVSAYVVGE